jgi:hypothetical protein
VAHLLRFRHAVKLLFRDLQQHLSAAVQLVCAVTIHSDIGRSDTAMLAGTCAVGSA